MPLPATKRQYRTMPHRAFTLIEVLVVVAIIALLISILMPSLMAAREQANRTVCASNMQQQGVGFHSYASEHNGYLPWRGWFSYTISETPHEAYGIGGNNSKVLVNLSLLMGKHLGLTSKPTPGSVPGKEWDVLYCPTTRIEFQEDRVGGLPSLWDPARIFTYGGYNYALPMAKRTGAPRLDENVYPRDISKLDSKWVDVLVDKSEGAADPLTYMPRGMQPLVTDFVIGTSKVPHRDAVNVAYSDGHTRFLQHPKIKPGGSGSLSSFELWYYAMLRP